jgi:hypothetical protein
MKKQILSEDFLRMQKLAGLITESEYKSKLSEDETLEEGWKDWVLGGLLTLSTLAGVGKVYQMDKQAENDKSKQIEYYDKVVNKELTKMNDDDLLDLGAKIAEKTGDMKGNSGADSDTYKKMMIQYAKDYIKNNPDQFAIGVDGGVYQVK